MFLLLFRFPAVFAFGCVKCKWCRSVGGCSFLVVCFLLRCCLYQSVDSDFNRGSSASTEGFCVHSHRVLFALGFNAFKSFGRAWLEASQASIFPDIFATRSQQWTYQWLTWIVFVINFPFCNIYRGSCTVGSFHAPWQFQDNISALGCPGKSQMKISESRWINFGMFECDIVDGWNPVNSPVEGKVVYPMKIQGLAPFQVQDFWPLTVIQQIWSQFVGLRE